MSPFESALYPVSAGSITPPIPGSITPPRDNRTGADVPRLIVHDAIEWNADMIVMGTHGRRGVTGWLVGSVAGRVAHITKTPVLLVSPSRA